MRTAVLYGIHANMPALLATVKDAEQQGVNRFVCLGDILGAGPNALECLLWARENLDWALLGFWDRALYDSEALEYSSAVNTNEVVTWGVEETLKHDDHEEIVRYISNLDSERTEGSIWFMYGCPVDPEWGYIAFEFVTQGVWEEARDNFQKIPSNVNLVLGGRTAIPRLATSDGRIRHASSLTKDWIEVSEDRKMAVSVGSVGSPRDKDPRSSYVICEEGRFRFRRVEYPVDELSRQFANATHLSEESRNWMIKRHERGV